MPTDFYFSVSCTGAPTLGQWQEVVRSAEGCGYDSLLVTDHLHQDLAPLPALVAAAACTRTLRLGTFVLCQDLRNPAVLARELATVDVLTEGRLDIGIGAGWLDTDYTSAGLAFESGPVRFERFTETVEVLLGSVADPAFTFTGKHHRVGKVDGGARCIQSPRPPVLIGASRPKMLALAASRADIVNITASTREHFAPASLDDKLKLVKDAAGERYARLRLGHVVWECLVTPRPDAVIGSFAGALGCTPEELVKNPAILIGSPEQLVEQLHERRELWNLTHVTIPQTSMASFASVIALIKKR